MQSMQEMYDAAATRDAQHASAGRGRGLSNGLRAATVINIVAAMEISNKCSCAPRNLTTRMACGRMCGQRDQLVQRNGGCVAWKRWYGGVAQPGSI